ncbi:hypothetical protein [Dyadobacter sp. NIV53]|uniref:hypothetical protein n=1 Tax=Dyadobacter sp. NIV53 TaxID=2861765 RepID=UPI001C879BB6|nr:hypothetical protein [Dyadobacter sp. NIV53]
MKIKNSIKTILFSSVISIVVFGYEFQLNGKIIGAVSTINNGKVWLQKDVSEEIKLVLASVSSGLMLRNNMEENALSLK